MTGNAESLLSAKHAAKYLGIGPSTLAKWRVAGTSPKFVKMGRRVAYRRGDLDAWIEERVQNSTSQTEQPSAA